MGTLRVGRRQGRASGPLHRWGIAPCALGSVTGITSKWAVNNFCPVQSCTLQIVAPRQETYAPALAMLIGLHRAEANASGLHADRRQHLGIKSTSVQVD